MSDSASGNYAASIGILSNTSGGAYQNLLITGNTLRVTGAQSSDPEVIRGIWENGHAHTSNITVSYNQFLNDSAGNLPLANLQRAFTVTSHSSASSTVTYSHNTVSGANLGWQWLAGQNFSGKLPVQITSNTLTNVGTGLLVQSNGSAVLSDNTIDNTGLPGAPGGVGVKISSGSSANINAAVGNNEFKGLNTAIAVNGGTATVSGNSASIHGNVIGIDVNGGSATVSANHIYDNTVAGVRLTSGGTANINGNNFEGGASDNAIDVQLTSSAGALAPMTGNTFAGSNFAIENLSPGAVTALNTGGSANTYDDAAGNPITNNFRIEDKVHHTIDNDTTGAGLVTWNTGDVYITDAGTDHFIQRGVNAAGIGNTVNVEAGTYDEDVSASVAGQTLLGDGAATTTIRGAIGGDSATMRIGASNVTVSGFTITRLGNTLADWNNPNLNTAGIAIQGQSITNAQIHDNIITGNRSAIDINNSNGHTIRNNRIVDNRTGVIFRNQTDNITFVENEVTNNTTLGILFLDGSGGTNSPVQSAVNCTFFNNNISGNWYGQIVDRQSGGSIPAPGTNTKNFSGNWFGSVAPVISTANSTEPRLRFADSSLGRRRRYRARRAT